MKKNRTDKEVAILEGTIALLRRGVHPYELKVSDIASEAGIGKGTVYQYFTTKEEVIGQSILYCVDKERQEMLMELERTTGFYPRLDLLLDQIHRNIMDPLSSFHMMISMKKLGGFVEKCHPGGESFQRDLEGFHDLLDRMVESGRKEGVIRGMDSLFYQRNVLKGALFAWGHHLMTGIEEDPQRMLQAKEEIRNMVSRAYQ